MAKAGNHLHDISNAIDAYIKPYGYGIVRDLVGHGIGTSLHEDPEIPNYVSGQRGIRIRPGMCLAIEPMVCQGAKDYYVQANEWTVCTRDGKLSAHYENSVLVTNGEPFLLTLPDVEEV